MSFSSPAFLFLFFPIFYLLYFALPMAARNAALLLASLSFYAIDGGTTTVILIASILINQVIGRIIHGTADSYARFTWMWLGILLNLTPLLYYKYWKFLNGVEHDALLPLGLRIELSASDIVLPAGISFFTFQGLSYLVDIYRREIAPARTLLGFGMYHTLFPQLIAGPIVRYIEVEDRIEHRPVTLADVEAGILRFCRGLGKKIIIADAMGSLADHMFSLAPDQLSMTGAWIGALSYTLQIYFDFSGYSDMAIGLGRMLGFRFPENFDMPYRSRSITEFWRRWHMTLSRWFRDYVYIPLGGNRAGPARTYVNLFAVFVLCGLWHGAAYTFLVWGCYHGMLLVVERIAGRHRGLALPSLLRWPVTLLLIVAGWVIFRAPSLGEAGLIFRAMAGWGPRGMIEAALVFVTPDKVVVFAIGGLLSVVRLDRRSFGAVAESGAAAGAQRLAALAVFLYSAVLIAANGFNPFIYFRF